MVSSFILLVLAGNFCIVLIAYAAKFINLHKAI